MNYAKILEELKTFIVEQGDKVYAGWENLKVVSSYDLGADMTTNFDKQIEKSFSEFVDKNFPQHGFRGEEFPELNRDAEYVWNIDPIDGTKYFARGIPFWSVTAALVQGENPLLGIVYDPVSRIIYEGFQDGGAYINGQKLIYNPTKEVDPKKLQVSVDLTTWKYDWDSLQDQLALTVTNLMKTFYRVRMFGAGAYSLSWLAQDMFGAYVDPYRHKKKFVDLAAGMIIAKEAGADIYRVNLDKEMEQIIIASPELIELIKPLIALQQS